MIETSLPGLLAFFALLALATAAGIQVARSLPLADDARSRALLVALGAALAPFLLGFAGVLALAALPGVSHATHYVATAGALAFTTALLWKLLPGPLPAPATRTAGDWIAQVLAILVAGFAVLLLVHATAIPLLQSDALEYATAGRWMYQVRSLSAYPPVDPVLDPSGFYGPWTHPPLYAALIYLANVSQGHADSPGLMRLLSPWALLAAAGVVHALGTLRSRLTGLTAALFLLGTPTLFLGADSAQVDAITVLGMTLVLGGCAGLRMDRVAGAAALGAIAGTAMWTHSQSVLVLPMTLFAMAVMRGRRDWRGTLRVLAVLSAGAVIVGAWPYVRNLQLSGALISDNPAVYALPQLDWAGYFRSERDLGSAVSRLLYGVLKGWTTLDAFALSFWFMTLGVALLFWRRVRAGASPTAVPGPVRARLENAALALLVCYLGGVVVSTVAGIDLMIRNERYFMIIMPCVAVLAAAGVQELIEHGYGRVPTIASVVVIAMFITELPVLFAYRMGRVGLSPGDLGLPMATKLDRLAPLGPIRVIRDMPEAANRGSVLTFKPADMYYARHRMVSYLDPRLVDVYGERDPRNAALLLHALGVTWVHVPPFANPPLYNSVIGALLSDPASTILEHADGGYQLYRLIAATGDGGTVCSTRNVGPESGEWRWSSELALGGAKQLLRIGGDGGVVGTGLWPKGRTALFPRERRTIVQSPVVPIARFSDAAEMRLELEVTGRGFAHVYVETIVDGSTQREELGGTLLSEENPRRTYARRFIIPPDASGVRLLIEYGGNASIGVASASLSHVCAGAPTDGAGR